MTVSTPSPSGVPVAQQLAQDLRTARHPRRWNRPLLRSILQGIAPAVNEVRALPRITLVLDTTGAGRDIRAHLDDRTCTIPTRLATSTLTLPPTGTAYLTGKKKQALRTNCTKAAATGIHCHQVTNTELRAHAHHLLTYKSTIADLDKLLAEPDRTGFESWIAQNHHGQVVALARLQLHHNVAWLKYLVATTDTEHSLARYPLSAAMFTNLADRGTHHVIVGPAIFLPPGLTYFQHLLGFHPTHITTTTPPHSPLRGEAWTGHN